MKVFLAGNLYYCTQSLQFKCKQPVFNFYNVFSLITLENPFYCCELLLYYLVYRDFSFLLSELATQLTRISPIWIREDGLLALVQPNIFHLKSIQLYFKLLKEKYEESNKHKAIELFIAVQTWKPLKGLIMG